MKQQYKDRNFIKLAKVTFKLSADGEIIKANVIEALPTVDAEIIPSNKVNGDGAKSDGAPSEWQELIRGQRKDMERVVKSVEDLKVDMTRLCGLIDGMHKNYIAHLAKGVDPPKTDLHAKYVQEKLDSLTKQVSTLEKQSKETDGRFGKLESKGTSPIEPSKESNNKEPVAIANGSSSRRSSKIAKLADPPMIPPEKTDTAVTIEKEPDLPQQSNRKSSLVREPVIDTSSLPSPTLNFEGPSTRKRLRKGKPLRRPTILKYNPNNRVALEGFGDGETPDAGHLEMKSAKVANSRRSSNLNKAKSVDNSPTNEDGSKGGLSTSTISSSEDEGEDEDEEYEVPEGPASPTSRRGGYRSRSGRIRGRGRGHAWTNGVKDGRLETPEWEKPDWTGQPVETPESGPPAVTTPVSSRGRQIIRRGHSGGNVASGSGSKRQKTTHADATSPGFVELGRVRDADGYLLRPNGERDRRSMRRKDAPPTQGSGKRHDKLMRQIFAERADGETAEGEQVEVKAEG
ncbi:MAG: hypothetical protein MMC33_002313 [Icmadophila ericetorum]|nr:hypothetical protein [Icmadophila ericetorum]